MGRKVEGELVSNRAAYHHYEVEDTVEAGIVLMGTEIKSLREGHGSLQDNYVDIVKSEAFLKQAFIPPYAMGNLHNHEERRERKLLLHKGEILKLKKMSQIKGYTLVALSFYLKKGIVKVRVGICMGKKLHDKRAAMKKKEAARTIERHLDR
jgi:SsrA-binding protein